MKMKRIISSILCVLMLISSFAFTASAESSTAWEKSAYILAGDSPLKTNVVGVKNTDHYINGPGTHNPAIATTNYTDKDNFDYIHSVVRYNDAATSAQRIIINPSLAYEKTTDNITIAILADYDNEFHDFLADNEASYTKKTVLHFYGVTGLENGGTDMKDVPAVAYTDSDSGYTLYLVELGADVGRDFTKFTSTQFFLDGTGMQTLLQEFAGSHPDFELFDYVGYAIYDGLFDENAQNSDEVIDSIIYSMLEASKVTDENTIEVTYDYNDAIPDETERYPAYSVLNSLSARKTYTLKTPTDVLGLFHNGWYANAEATGEAVTSVAITADTTDLTYYAKLSQKEDIDLTITTIVTGGSQSDEQIAVPYNTYVKDIEKPSVQGKYFLGWFSDEACTTPVSEDTRVTDALTQLYAKMGDFAHNITLYRNTSSADPEKVVLSVTDGSGLRDSDYPDWVQNKDGWVYRITSWNTKADGTGTEMPDTFTAPDENAMNLSYYAQWEKETTLSADSKSVLNSVWQDKININVTASGAGHKYTLGVDENDIIYADTEVKNMTYPNIAFQVNFSFSDPGNATVAIITDKAAYPADVSTTGIGYKWDGTGNATFKYVYSSKISGTEYYIHMYSVDLPNETRKPVLNVVQFRMPDLQVGSTFKYVGFGAFNGRLEDENTATNAGKYDDIANGIAADILGYAKARPENVVTVNYHYGDDIVETDKYVNKAIRKYYDDLKRSDTVLLPECDTSDYIIRTLDYDPTGGYLETIDGWYDNSDYTGAKVPANTVVSTPDSTASAPTVHDYYANVELKAVEVTFNPNGGEGQEETLEYNYGDTIDTKTYPAFTRDGVSPLGFATSPDATEYIAIADFDNTSVTGDVTYYAIWPTPYKVIFYDEDGTTVLTQFNDYNGSFTYQPEDRPGLDLEGWYINDSDVLTPHDGVFEIDGDTTFVAKYTVTDVATYVLDGKYTPAKDEYEVKLYFVGDDNVSKLSFGYQWNKSDMTLVSVTPANIVDAVSEIHAGDIDADKAGYSATYTMADGTPIDAADGKVLVATFVFIMDETQRAAFIANGNYFAQYIDADTAADLYEADTFKCFYEGDTGSANIINTPVYEIIDERLYIKDFAFDIIFNGRSDNAVESGKQAVIEYRVNGEGEFVVLEWTDSLAKTVAVSLPEYTAVEGEKLEIRVKKPGYISDEIVIDALASGDVIELEAQAGDIKGSANDTYGDGVIDFNDYLRVINAFTDALKGNAEYCNDVDIDEDGVVTVFDLNIIKDYLANN